MQITPLDVLQRNLVAQAELVRPRLIAPGLGFQGSLDARYAALFGRDSDISAGLTQYVPSEWAAAVSWDTVVASVTYMGLGFAPSGPQTSGEEPGMAAHQVRSVTNFRRDGPRLSGDALREYEVVADIWGTEQRGKLVIGYGGVDETPGALI